MSLLSRTSAALAALALSSALLTRAAAAEERTWTLSPNVSFTTDYIFRGFSQSARGLVGQGGADATYGIFYAGVWTSGLRFGELDGGSTWARQEVDLYAGIKPKVGPVTFDLGVIYYAYPNSSKGTLGGTEIAKLDYVEAKLGASVEPWKNGTLSATMFYSPEYTNKQGKVTTLEGSFAQVLPSIGAHITPTFSALIGYQQGKDGRFEAFTTNGGKNYTYYNVGMNFAFWEKLSLDLRYWNTNVKNANPALTPNDFCKAESGLFRCDANFVGTLKLQF